MYTVYKNNNLSIDNKSPVCTQVPIIFNVQYIYDMVCSPILYSPSCLKITTEILIVQLVLLYVCIKFDQPRFL